MAIAQKPRALNEMRSKAQRQKWKSTKGRIYSRKPVLSPAQVGNLLKMSGASGGDINRGDTMVTLSYSFRGKPHNFLVVPNKVPESLRKYLRF